MEQVKSILHQCEQCNKRFPCKPSLDRHEITHDLEVVASWVSTQAENQNTSTSLEQAITVHIPPHKKLVAEANGTENAFSDDAKRMTSIQQECMLQVSKQPYVKSVSVWTKPTQKDPNDEHNDELETENDKQLTSSDTPTKSENGNKRPRMTAQTPREKIYVCDECTRSYTRRDHLNRHKLSHTGERPFVCSVCLKSFIRKDKLQRHERIHSGDKVCSCNICGKFFSRKDMLVKHLKVHSDGSIPSVKKVAATPKKVRQPDFILKEKAERQATHGVMEEPLTVSKEPNSVSQEPLSVSQKPLSVSQEPQSVSEKPHSVAQDSLSVSMESLSTPIKMETPPFSLKEEPIYQE